MATTLKDADTAVQRRQLGPQVPAEGDNGVFTQSWFPICMSSELAPGAVKGVPFLGGRVVAFRGEDGKASVVSAYCPHLGADLAVGSVAGNSLRCAYHQWEFDKGGNCLKTGCGDPAPSRAKLFSFPTQERHGIIWAYNGNEPHYDLPDWPVPRENLLIETTAFPVPMNVDPWVICAQTPDIQHVKLLHKFDMHGPDPANHVEWTDHSMYYPLNASWGGRRFDVRVGIVGTSFFIQTGTLDGRWFGFITAFSLPRPGETNIFGVFATERTGNDEEAKRFLDEARELEIAIAMQDSAIGQSIHLKVGSLTKSDATLGKFFDYVRRFPRAHPSAEFIS